MNPNLKFNLFSMAAVLASCGQPPSRDASRIPETAPEAKTLKESFADDFPFWRGDRELKQWENCNHATCKSSRAIHAEHQKNHKKRKDRRAKRKGFKK